METGCLLNLDMFVVLQWFVYSIVGKGIGDIRGAGSRLGGNWLGVDSGVYFLAVSLAVNAGFLRGLISANFIVFKIR